MFGINPKDKMLAGPVGRILNTVAFNLYEYHSNISLVTFKSYLSCIVMLEDISQHGYPQNFVLFSLFQIETQDVS